MEKKYYPFVAERKFTNLLFAYVLIFRTSVNNNCSICLFFDFVFFYLLLCCDIERLLRFNYNTVSINKKGSRWKSIRFLFSYFTALFFFYGTKHTLFNVEMFTLFNSKMLHFTHGFSSKRKFNSASQLKFILKGNHTNAPFSTLKKSRSFSFCFLSKWCTNLVHWTYLHKCKHTHTPHIKDTEAQFSQWNNTNDTFWNKIADEKEKKNSEEKSPYNALHNSTTYVACLFFFVMISM